MAGCRCGLRSEYGGSLKDDDADADYFQHRRNMEIGRPRSSIRRTYFPPSLLSPNLNRTFQTITSSSKTPTSPSPSSQPPPATRPAPPVALLLPLPFTHPMPQPHRNSHPNPTTHRSNPPPQQPKPRRLLSSPSSTRMVASLSKPHLHRPRNACRPEPHHDIIKT